MSEMEYNKGILRPLNIDTDDYTDDEYEAYTENGYVVIHGEIYEVHWEVQSGDLPNIKNVTMDDAGFIHFETYHYNGGAHWTEVVESALK